jgi:hypothetical protein
MAVASSVAPYGYTLTIWTSGAVLSHARGIPDSVDAVLFMLGAVAGFAAVGLVAFGRLHARLVAESFPTLWTGIHVLSIGLAIGTATLVAHLLEDIGAWPVTGFAVTVIYLCVLALQLALAGQREL